MKRGRLKKVITMVLVLSILATSIPTNASKKAAKGITTGSYIKLLEEAIGQKPEEGSDYREKAMEIGLVSQGEQIDYNKNITRVDAAVYTNRADEIKNGKKYDEKLYAQVKNKKRITGLSKIPISKVSSVRKSFVKGLMVGYSNGKCSQDRNFKGTEYLAKTEATKIISRLKDKRKRMKLSYDGQVIRTTNLPKNYKKFSYILESFPNDFYEQKFFYELNTYSYKPKEFKDYACPARHIQKGRYKNVNEEFTMKETAEKYLDTWCEKVEKNVRTRLSFNYKTSGVKWINELNSTYMGNKISSIEDYVKEAKKNKVIIEVSKVIVEPSSLYYDLGQTLRVYAKFRIKSASQIPTAMSGYQSKKLIYGESIFFENLKKGKWIEGYYEIQLGTNVMNSDGAELGVVTDYLWDRYEKR